MKSLRECFRKLTVSILIVGILPIVSINAEAAGKIISASAVESFVATAEGAIGKTRSQLSGNPTMPSGESWCGYFVGWAINHSTLINETGTISADDCGPCSNSMEWAAKKRFGTIYIAPGSIVKENINYYYQRLIDWGVPTSNIVKVDSFTPQRGDLVLYDWVTSSNPVDFDHIGIMTSQTGTVEGNSGLGETDTRKVIRHTLSESTYNGKRGDYVIGYMRFSTAPAPAAPENLRAAAKTYDSVTISWDRVTGAASYEVQYYSRTAGTWKNDSDYASGTSYVSTGLDSYDSYQFRVRAVNAAGTSGWTTVTYTRPTYTVSYNADGGSGAPSSQTKNYGQTLTLSSVKPTRSGYAFQGWATSPSGSVQYQPGGAYTANAGAMLYAVWKTTTYTIAYDANGGSGAPASQTKQYNQPLTLSSVKPTRSGYTFMGWATAPDGSTEYQPGDPYTKNEGVTLYAIWDITSYLVRYDLNGGTGSMYPQLKMPDQPKKLWTDAPTKEGYVFAGWATTLNGSVEYHPGDFYYKNENVILYAIWEKEVTYTLCYDANGGSGAPASQTGKAGQAVTLSTVIPTREGYTFKGWSVNTIKEQFQPGDTVYLNQNITLYAIWKQNNEAVSVTSVTLDKSTLTLNEGESAALTATVQPSDATDKTVTWTSSDDSVAKVSSTGMVTAITAGKATITATAGGKSASCTVTVMKAAAEDAAQLVIEKVTAIAGDTVAVTVKIQNNPGFGGMAYDVTFDNTVLDLVSYELGLGSGICVVSGENYSDKVNFQYAGIANVSGDGALVTFTFKIKDTAPAGFTAITVVPEDGTAFRYEGQCENDFELVAVNGGIEIIDYLKGDINGDGKVNNRDAARLMQYLAGWDVEYVAAALDVNGDGKVNNRDAARLMQYLAGWDVEIN